MLAYSAARDPAGWIQTYTGKKFWPLEPRVEEVDIEDIAHALSNLCRFAGHVTQFYSVAQHSVIVSEQCPFGAKLWGLLHDAPEAYMVDLPQPIKHDPTMRGYRVAEEHLMRCIGQRFALTRWTPEAVSRCDRLALCAERRDLLRPLADEDWLASVGGGYVDPISIPTIRPWSPAEAEERFLDAFAFLYTGR
jgi:uncharacterized protein